MAKREGLSFYKRRKKISSRTVKEVFSWMFSILLAMFLAVVLVYFFGMTSTVVGASMEPGLASEQRILIDRLRYVVTGPERGDVVLFLPNGNENSHYYTKRVVAKPGDSVRIEDGVLYVDGEESPFVSEWIEDPGIAGMEFTLDAGEYFVMGDAPASSEDSRSADIGPVELDDIIGRVWFALPSGGNEMHLVR